MIFTLLSLEHSIVPRKVVYKINKKRELVNDKNVGTFKRSYTRINLIDITQGQLRRFLFIISDEMCQCTAECICVSILKHNIITNQKLGNQTFVFPTFSTIVSTAT